MSTPTLLVTGASGHLGRAVMRRLDVPGAFDMVPMADGKVRVIGDDHVGVADAGRFQHVRMRGEALHRLDVERLADLAHQLC